MRLSSRMPNMGGCPTVSRLKKMVMLASFSSMVTIAGSAHAEYLKAITYFGDSWPIAYWNSNTDRAAQDFKEMQSVGFNTVIMVVPWGEFQPGLDPVVYNERAFRDLGRMCRLAKNKHLHFFLRVSYLWDMYPDEQKPNIARGTELFTSDHLTPQWQQYLARIASATRGCGDGYFISWEDFWHMISIATSGGDERGAARIAQQIGYDAWVRKHGDAEYLARNKDVANRLGAYPIPDRKSPDFKQVFRWFDDVLMTHLYPAFSKTLPNASVEARVDDDPIYNNGKIVEWYNHNQTYKISGSPYVMTYWAPAMGALNQGEKEPAAKVAQRFTDMQKKVMNQTKNKVFIEQFLFEDNTPSAAMNASIVQNQTAGFIENLSGALLKSTSGYALWGFQDYDASIVFNGFFKLGQQGWDFKKGASVTNSSHDAVADIPVHGMIAQAIPLERDHFRSFSKTVTLRFTVEGTAIIQVSYGGIQKKIETQGHSHEISMQIPMASGDTVLSFETLSGHAKISRVYLYSFTLHSEIHNAHGSPLKYLNSFKVLNNNIDAGVGLPTHLSAKDKSISSMAGVYTPERDGNNWFAWAGPSVHTTLFASTSNIAVQGYIRPEMFKSRRLEGCTVNAYINQTLVSSKRYSASGQLDMAIPVPQKWVRTPVDLSLTSNCQINPKQDKIGDDDRTLSFILSDINASTAKP